jgi:hypothetical protein
MHGLTGPHIPVFGTTDSVAISDLPASSPFSTVAAGAGVIGASIGTTDS